MKQKSKKRPVKGNVKAKPKKSEKKLITGNTEILDFDFDEELFEENMQADQAKQETDQADNVSAGLAAVARDSVEICQELSDDAADSGADPAETVEAVSEVQEPVSNVSVSSWETMPEQEVTIGDQTMELLGMESVLLEESVNEQPGKRSVKKKNGYEEFEDIASNASGGPDYMDFVPKKTKKPQNKKKTAAVAVASKENVPRSANKSQVAVKKSTGSGKGRHTPRKKRKKAGFLEGFDVMDRIIAATGVLVVLVAIMTAGIYSLTQSAQKQVAAVAEVGMKMEAIGIAGEGIITAVADARIAAQEAAEYVEEEITGEVGEYEEKELTTEMKVGLKLTSVQRDLKIKFTNKSSGKLIGNQPFEVEIKGPESMTKADDDEDGIIYISSIKAGEYTVTITAPEEIDGNKVKGVSSIVTVKDQIEYKKIDVADEVKTESEINAAQEDTKVEVAVESVTTDTVEWVESTKTPISGSVSYVEVKKSDIPDPAGTASAGFEKIAAAKSLAGISAGAGLLLKGESEDEPFLSVLRKLDHDRMMKQLETVQNKENNVRVVPVTGQEPPKVDTVTISGATEADVGKNVELTATVEMSDGSPYTGEITWDNGMKGNTITLNSATAATITVTASAGDVTSASHSVVFQEVQESPVVESVSISGPTSAKVGEKVTLTASLTMTSGSAEGVTIKWTNASGSGTTATVEAQTAGPVTVTAEAGGQSASHTVEFAEAAPAATVKSVTVSPSATSVNTGASVTLSASVEMTDGSAYNGSVSWSADGGSLNTSASPVTLTSNEAKTITVTATADGVSGTASVTFSKADVKVTKVTLDKSALTMKVGENVGLAATVEPSDATNKSIAWSSDNSAVAAVDSSGKVTAVAAGTANITAKSADGASAACKVTVNSAEVKVTKVTLDQTEITLKKGENKTLKATVEPSNATNKSITWSSSDTKIAAVDSTGKVTAVAAGTATITAKSADGPSATCKITVSVVAVGVTLEDPGTITAGEEKQLKWTTTGDVDTSKTKVTSSDTKVATVDDKGKVKALAKGSVTITVTVTDKAGKTAQATGKLTVNAAEELKIVLDPSTLSLKVGDKVTVKATVTGSGNKGIKWDSSNHDVLQIISSSDTECTVKALKTGDVKLTAESKEKAEIKAVCTVKIGEAVDMTAKLKDRSGRQLYVKEGDTYREATVADYYTFEVFYRKDDTAQYTYTGWQNLDGKRYYFDKTGKPVTGDQIIQGMQYSFKSDGSLKVNAAFGIDVSKHNGNIDWNAVKNSGVEFVIIRCGYRGSATGVLVEDPKFRTNVQGAINAGLKVGIYFFSQAVNEVEAVEEASMTISLINKYKITYPVYMDVEGANGRGDRIDPATRTKVIKAYCQTIKNSGYTAGIYANKSWLNTMFNVGEMGNYKIWLAQYAAVPTYNGRYEMWQYSSTGRISGISGNVDLNTSYMVY